MNARATLVCSRHHHMHSLGLSMTVATAAAYLAAAAAQSAAEIVCEILLISSPTDDVFLDSHKTVSGRCRLLKRQSSFERPRRIKHFPTIIAISATVVKHSRWFILSPDMPSDKPPVPAYQATPGSILHPDRDLYTSIATAERVQIDAFTLPIRSGTAWKAPQRSIVRISTPEGPQVGDLNVWNAANPRERFWAARTRQLHASHVSLYDRLWSCLPYLRPMVTIIADSLSGYGVDQWGGRCHDLLGTRCDPYVNAMLTGGQYDFHCHSNLVRAVMPFGLLEWDVHDVLNVFQVTGLDEKGRYFMEASPAKKGDYIEFFCEMECLMALSTCPGGDLSSWGWDEGASKEGQEERSMLECCRPLKVEVFRLVDEERVLKDWKQPVGSTYRGMHGIKVPTGESQQIAK